MAENQQLNPIRSYRNSSPGNRANCYNKTSRFITEMARTIVVKTKGRPNFGFGFGAECVQCSTFGIHSVSAESNSATSGKISVSAAAMAEIRRTPKVGHLTQPSHRLSLLALQQGS